MRSVLTSLLISMLLIMVCSDSAISQTHSIYGNIRVVGRTELFDVSVWIDAHNITQTHENGKYQLDDVPDGIHSVYAWYENCLVKKIGTVTIDGFDVVNVDGELFMRDFQQDGRINLHDMRTLLDHFMQTPDSLGWDHRFDIYEDQVIDSLDLALLAEHWREKSDSETPPWQVEITEPNQATVWHFIDEDLPVRWETGNLGFMVSIELYKGDSRFASIGSSTENDGEFLFSELPGDILEGDDYRIRIANEVSGETYSEYFTIDNSMMIFEPNSQTRWCRARENVPIRWHPGRVAEDVSIVLMMDSMVVDTIVHSTLNDGYYEEYDISPSFSVNGEYSIIISAESGVSLQSEVFRVIYSIDVWTQYAGDLDIVWTICSGPYSPISVMVYKGEELVQTLIDGGSQSSERGYYYIQAIYWSRGTYRVLVRNDDYPDLYFGWSESFHVGQ